MYPVCVIQPWNSLRTALRARGYWSFGGIPGGISLFFTKAHTVMALMKTTTEPNPIPNPSTSELLTLGDELDPGCAEDVGKLAPPSDVVIPVVEVEVVVIDDVPVVDSELAEEDVDVVEIEVIVVGVMCPKMDAATEDICGSATAWIPLQSATRGCFKGASLSVHLLSP